MSILYNPEAASHLHRVEQTMYLMILRQHALKVRLKWRIEVPFDASVGLTTRHTDNQPHIYREMPIGR